VVHGQNILGQYTVPFRMATNAPYYQVSQFATPDGSGGLFVFNPPNGSLHRFDATGKELWTTSLSFGSLSGVVAAMAVAADGVYLAGQVNGALFGLANAGSYDAFAVKYDLNGKTLWTREFGTADGDFVRVVAPTSNGVYILGLTGAATGPAFLFIRSLDINGSTNWTRQFRDATLLDLLGGAADSSGVYFFGYGAVPGASNVVRKFDSQGNDLWTHQLDRSSIILGLAPDAQGVYVLFFPGPAIYTVRRLNLSGSEIWTRKLVSSNVAGTIAADSTGFYLAGVADGALPGQCYAGQGDVFLMRFDSAGDNLWTREFGAAGLERQAEISIGSTSVDVTGFGAGSIFLTTIEKASAPVADSKPRISWECVVNAANHLGGGVAPGEIVTIFGSAMGPSDLAGLQPTADGHVPTVIAGTRILFDGEAAPLLYVSAQQSSAMVPYAVAGKSTVDVQVEYNGVRSSAVKMPVLGSRLGIFTFGPAGTGQAAIVNQDGTMNSSFNPAAAGSIVSIYATGGGLPLTPGADDQITGDNPSTFKSSLFIRLMNNGSDDDSPYFPAEVMYYGGAPRSLAGLIQINARLPRDVPPGNAVPLYVGTDSGQAVEQVATIAIR
jgi:uncharacterized protein (TIGR03437 family)